MPIPSSVTTTKAAAAEARADAGDVMDIVNALDAQGIARKH
jgi:hypothetical protein